MSSQLSHQHFSHLCLWVIQLIKLVKIGVNIYDLLFKYNSKVSTKNKSGRRYYI